MVCGSLHPGTLTRDPAMGEVGGSAGRRGESAGGQGRVVYGGVRVGGCLTTMEAVWQRETVGGQGAP